MQFIAALIFSDEHASKHSARFLVVNSGQAISSLYNIIIGIEIQLNSWVRFLPQTGAFSKHITVFLWRASPSRAS
jgi:hypothetical protein